MMFLKGNKMILVYVDYITTEKDVEATKIQFPCNDTMEMSQGLVSILIIHVFVIFNGK